jgi:2-keto-4-pentenoate hydratase/2-oxohepta-3-ene-1,7-dioic acid hydratase in catechol pathway
MALPETSHRRRLERRASGTLCVGLNYRGRATETRAPIPEEPIICLKTAGTAVGPDDDVLVPRCSVKTDYEVELAVVIGREACWLFDAATEEEVSACSVSPR